MAITDLTGYTWVGNDVLYGTTNRVQQIDFEDKNKSAYHYIYALTVFSTDLQYRITTSGAATVAYRNGWSDTSYKTIEITGGEDATNPDLISWLEANGTLTKGGGGDSMLNVTYNSIKIIDSLEVTPPVTVTYNGNTIATLNAGDTKTLQCNGKVMASNVVIGDKTLQCNGKLMASNVVVEVGGNW